MKMDHIPLWKFSIFMFLLSASVNSEEDDVKQALVEFMKKLSPGNTQSIENFGWNMTSDPCTDKWVGVSCDSRIKFVRRIVLNEFNLTGTLDAVSLCVADSLVVLSLESNDLVGEIPDEITRCKSLTHLYLSGNRFSGSLPDSFSRLSNLKRLDISKNNFSGKLPDLPRISGLISFIADNNQLSEEIPGFDFSNLQLFNVSNNNFSGPIPQINGPFSANSFLGNPELCGIPLSNICPPLPPPPKKKSKDSSTKRFLVFSGYIILGFAILSFIVFKFVIKKKRPTSASSSTGVGNRGKNAVAVDSSSNKPSSTSSDSKASGNRSEYSITSVESGMASSLVVLKGPVVKALKFDDLLRAPAELLGRGKHGSLYKVILDDGVTLAVKRIKDWGISSENFGKRMQMINQVKHPNVLPVVAFYCSNQEKLLVYEYQQNGSLFRLLHGAKEGQIFDWGSRLSVAASTAEALAFMHEELCDFGIAHGNLKSTNILLNKNMDSCISEYGLMVVENQEKPILPQTSSFKFENTTGGGAPYSSFKVDIYGFGVVLLELLTGKLVQNNGFDLAKWVHSVVREEWTVEVFDKVLIMEGACEERMVNLLQVALKCIHPSPNERPSINQVAVMINVIKEEEERSIISDP